MQGNPVMKAGLSCNYYKISLVTGKNSNNCRTTLLLSQNFPVRTPLVLPCSVFQCNCISKQRQIFIFSLPCFCFIFSISLLISIRRPSQSTPCHRRRRRRRRHNRLNPSACRLDYALVYNLRRRRLSYGHLNHY